MASIHPHRSGFRVCYRVLGKQINDTVPDKATAVKRCAEVEYQLSRGIDPRTNSRIVAGVGITIEAAISEFIQWSAGQGRAARSCERDLQELTWLAEYSPQFVGQIKIEHLQQMISDFAPKCPSSHNKVVAALRAFGRCAVQNGWWSENIALQLHRQKVPHTLPDIFSITEIKALLSVADSPVRELIAFVATTGCRIGEATALRWTDIRDNFAVIHGPKERRDKMIAIAPEVLADITKLPRRGPYVFTTRNGTPLNRNNISKLLKDYAEEVGLDRRTTHWHKFRHTAATRMAAVLPVGMVQLALGHSSVQMTEKYVHLAGLHLKTITPVVESYASELYNKTVQLSGS